MPICAERLTANPRTWPGNSGKGRCAHPSLLTTDAVSFRHRCFSPRVECTAVKLTGLFQADKRRIFVISPDIDTHQVWHVERNGINPINASGRHGTVRQVFWLWFAGNLSFTYLVIGAVVWSYGLSLGQSVLAIATGLLSFAAIGYLGIPGKVTGLPTMAYSEKYFGPKANRFIALIAWLNMVGWETIVLIIGSYALQTVFHLVFGVPLTAVWLVASLGLTAAAELFLAFLGHATIEYLQQRISYIFGFLTLLVILALLPHTAWHAVWTHSSGSWLKGVIPAITIVVAVSALSWITTASDYTRYLPHHLPNRRIAYAATLGSIIPTLGLMLTGLLLAQSAPALATAANPVEFLLHWLPLWAQIPYLIITLTGMLAGGILCAYSSGLSLLAAGVKVPRSRTVGIDAVLSITASLYVLLVSQGFLNSFEGFLEVIATFLAPWAAIALLNVRQIQPTAPSRAIIAWLIGAAVALSTTSTPVFTGPLAVGIFNGSSLGYFVGFAVTALVYISGKRQSPGGPF
ncbi:MAG: hypothetical protein C7B44_14740 [Sulfobacillus thermosulfidooxidans]|nr:MAG: hypothetical protein C7B44_14740 [Sulfobacillus thermosulfidooxidans]